MISAGYKSAYQQGYSDAMRDFRKETKTDGDAISRQAVLARIDAERKHLLELKMDGAEHIVVHHARRIIEDMPSVNPQEPKADITEIRNLLAELIDMIDNGSQRDLDRADEIAEIIVKALEQEPCEDCISREYVLALLENKKRTRKEITNRIYEYVQGVSE